LGQRAGQPSHVSHGIQREGRAHDHSYARLEHGSGANWRRMDAAAGRP
jgi:hypothetical protein